MRYCIGYGYLALVFIVMICVQKLFRLSVEVSRKITHILIGFTWVILYRFFILPPEVAAWELLVMPVSFIVINSLSYRYKIFTMIEREGENNHPGTVYYAVAMTVLLFLTIPFPFLVVPSGIAVFCLSFGDGFAALFGSLFGKHGPHIMKDKSLVGTTACFIGGLFAVYFLMLFVPYEMPLWGALLIAAVTAGAELCGHGLDNFAISFGVTAVSAFLMEVAL